MSSAAHRITGMRWDDVHFDEGGYERFVAYGQSKTANVLFALHLDALGQERGVRAFSLHPGAILTPLQRHLTTAEMVEMGWVDAQGAPLDPSFKSPEQGAATQVWAATSPWLEGLGGVYAEDCEVASIQTERGQDPPGVAPHAVDPDDAARLWELSTELTGIAPVSR